MKEYLKVLWEVGQTIVNLATGINQNPDDREYTSAAISDIQAQMIQLGTELEQRFHLENSRILHLLETGCELCYKTITGEMDTRSFCQYINIMLHCMEHEYFFSTPEGAYDLSIAAIIKNEPNIIEWIEYHLMVGVQHFYIYDNESTDGLERKLQKYIHDGTVTYIYWPGKYQQLPVYNHAISHYQNDTRWLAIIDGDEYIVPVKGDKLIPQILDEIDAQHLGMEYRDYCIGGIAVQWRVYGTCGHKTNCSGLLFENYRYRAADDFHYNIYIKTICNPRLAVKALTAHTISYISNYRTVSDNGSVIPTHVFYDGSCSKLRINHYRIRSDAEFYEKNRRGWPDKDLQIEENELYEANVDCSKVYDPIMNRYIDELKRRVASYEESNR
jgi:hypothetical protein